jgi:hypothetical protein
MGDMDAIIKLGRELSEYTYNRDKVLMLGYGKIKFNQPIEKGYFEKNKSAILLSHGIKAPIDKQPK